MELYLLTTLLLVLIDPGIMKTEARFDISSRSVMTKDESSDNICHKQSVLLTHDKLSETCGTLHPEQQFEARIINGHKAGPGQFPFAVKITDNIYGFAKCGGSIIDSKYILTAAHCITKNGTRILKKVDELKIEVGSHFFDLSGQNEDCRVRYDVKKLHIHPYYSRPTKAHDIGIIELKEPINFEYYREGYGSRGPICLADGDEDLVRVGQKLSVAGWGSTSIFGHKPDVLNFDTYRVLDRSNCKNSSVSDICMDDSNVYKSTFYGDSGSALFKKIDNQYSIQVGIVSGFDWCQKIQVDPVNKPHKLIKICFNTIYTRVDSHLDWIKTIIGRKPTHE